MRANLLGRPRYSERIGTVEARVVLTVNGAEFFWLVEVVTGVGIRELTERDGTSKKWPLLEVDAAQIAARQFARSLQWKKAA